MDVDVSAYGSSRDQAGSRGFRVCFTKDHFWCVVCDSEFLLLVFAPGSKRKRVAGVLALRGERGRLFITEYFVGVVLTLLAASAPSVCLMLGWILLCCIAI